MTTKHEMSLISKDDIEFKASLNILYIAIRRYFEFPWARNYSEDREIQYAYRVMNMITNALKLGELPNRLKIQNFIPAEVFFYKINVNRYMIENQFRAVANYYEDLTGMPYEMRMQKHQEKINNAR